MFFLDAQKGFPFLKFYCKKGCDEKFSELARNSTTTSTSTENGLIDTSFSIMIK